MYSMKVLAFIRISERNWIKRTELDEEGNLYPLLYMKRIDGIMCTKAKVVRRFPLKMVALSLYKCFVPLYHFSFPS